MCCAAAAVLPATAGAAGRAPLDANPCLTPFKKGLRCPDMVMDRPWGLYMAVSYTHLTLPTIYSV